MAAGKLSILIHSPTAPWPREPLAGSLSDVIRCNPFSGHLLVLEGIDLGKGQRRKRYRLPATAVPQESQPADEGQVRS